MHCCSPSNAFPLVVVFLKLDVEGAEYPLPPPQPSPPLLKSVSFRFDILRGLFALGAADLIDEVLPRPLHALRLLLSARLLQATIEFHSRMKGELSAFAEQVLLCCFFIVRLFVNRRFLNCHLMLCVAVYGVFFSPQFDCSLRALSYVSFSRIAVVACFLPPFSPVFGRSAC
jgi:hypothetical protein